MPSGSSGSSSKTWRAGAERAALDLGDHGRDPRDLRAVHDPRAELGADDAQVPQLRAARELARPIEQREPRGRAAAARRAVDLAVREHGHVALHERRAVVHVLPEDHAVDVPELRLERVRRRRARPRSPP